MLWDLGLQVNSRFRSLNDLRQTSIWTYSAAAIASSPSSDQDKQSVVDGRKGTSRSRSIVGLLYVET